MLGVVGLEGLDDEWVPTRLEACCQLSVLPVWETAEGVAALLDDRRALVVEPEQPQRQQDVPERSLPLLRVLLLSGVFRVGFDDHPSRPKVVPVTLGVPGVDGFRGLPIEPLVLLAVVVARRVEHVVDAQLIQVSTEPDRVHERVGGCTGFLREENITDGAVEGHFAQKRYRVRQVVSEFDLAVNQSFTEGLGIRPMFGAVLYDQNPQHSYPPWLSISWCLHCITIFGICQHKKMTLRIQDHFFY